MLQFSPELWVGGVGFPPEVRAGQLTSRWIGPRTRSDLGLDDVCSNRLRDWQMSGPGRSPSAALWVLREARGVRRRHLHQLKRSRR
jgi:hypothetical protein